MFEIISKTTFTLLINQNKVSNKNVDYTVIPHSHQITND